MAILKHIASKNADYGEAQRYLMFQYNEDTMKPILDENGRLIPREEYYLDGINCDPFTFDMECKELNAQYRKNQTYDEIKSHHYILRRSSSAWSMPGKIFPVIRLWSVLIRTGITEAATSMYIL